MTSTTPPILPQSFNDDLKKFKEELSSYQINTNYVLGPILLAIDLSFFSFKHPYRPALVFIPIFLLIYCSVFFFRMDTLQKYKKNKKAPEYKNGLIILKKEMSIKTLHKYSIFLVSAIIYLVILLSFYHAIGHVFTWMKD
jgi:hypothetical protein